MRVLQRRFGVLDEIKNNENENTDRVSVTALMNRAKAKIDAQTRSVSVLLLRQPRVAVRRTAERRMSPVLSPSGVENNDECRREREGVSKGRDATLWPARDASRQTDRLLADRR